MRIGVDLGGTKIEAVAIDGSGAQLVRKRVPTPVGDYEGTMTAIARLVESIEQELGEVGSVGIGTPGAISPVTGLLRNSNSLSLNGRLLESDLRQALGRDIRIANDANCFALSEAVDGAGEEAVTVFGVIIGTGVGGGLVVNRTVLVGPNAIAGEWGHNELVGESERRGCYCGRVDCVEQYLSGPALAREYFQRTDVDLTAPDLIALVDSDPVAEEILGRYITRLARALAQVINIVDPDVIVLGGGMSNVEALYRRVPEKWGQWVFSDEVTTPLLKNHHGDSGGVRGAAWLWD